VGRGEKRREESVIEGEIESNAETQKALRIRREEKGLTQRTHRSEHRGHGEFLGSEKLRAFGDLREKMKIARVIYSAAKIGYLELPSWLRAH
jgi:hypothetical protein